MAYVSPGSANQNKGVDMDKGIRSWLIQRRQNQLEESRAWRKSLQSVNWTLKIDHRTRENVERSTLSRSR